jgi:hypothetical protein
MLHKNGMQLDTNHSPADPSPFETTAPLTVALLQNALPRELVLWRAAHLRVLGRKEFNFFGAPRRLGRSDDELLVAMIDQVRAERGQRPVGLLPLFAAASWVERGQAPPSGPHLALWGPHHQAWQQAGMSDDAILTKLRAFLAA